MDSGDGGEHGGGVETENFSAWHAGYIVVYCAGA